MPSDTLQFYYFLGPAIVVIGILAVFVRLRIRREPTELHKAIAFLKFSTLITGGFLLLLWFLLPCTPVLSSFGYPKTVADVQSATKLLAYLQDYDKAIVRTTMILYWFIFVFIWWFLSSVFALSKALTKMADEQQAKADEKAV
jgi:hypothetical protein